jgi:hypothetical protein
MVPSIHLLFAGGFVLFRLFGLVFAAVGLLNLLRPREMTAYTIRRRTAGEVDGRIEPTRTRLLLTRLFGGVGVVVGLGLALGLLGP